MRFQELFDHMEEEHGLLLLESEMFEIERIIVKQLQKESIVDMMKSDEKDGVYGTGRT